MLRSLGLRVFHVARRSHKLSVWLQSDVTTVTSARGGSGFTPRNEAAKHVRPIGEHRASFATRMDGSAAERGEAPEAGLEPATRSLSEPGEPTSDGAAKATTGPEVPPVERPTSEESPPKPSPKPSPRRRGGECGGCWVVRAQLVRDGCTGKPQRRPPKR